MDSSIVAKASLWWRNVGSGEAMEGRYGKSLYLPLKKEKERKEGRGKEKEKKIYETLVRH